MYEKGNPKLITAWAMYDWANSVYSLVISTAVFPIYYVSVTSSESNMISFLGSQWENTVIYSYCLSFSFLIVAILSPILSGIADHTGSKKGFLRGFCYLGAISCGMLFFFSSPENVTVGLVFSILASIGFWGSIVFYNSFLPEIAYPEQQDKASAKGFSLGYLGSSILLILCLLLVTFYENLGLPGPGMATRISFVMVASWWIFFAERSLAKLPSNVFNKVPHERYIFKGWKELVEVFNQIWEEFSLKRFIIGFFLLSIGVQTTVLVASLFGEKELHMESTQLILTILIIQFVGILGAWLFSRLSEKWGNIPALSLSLVGWATICFLAFSLHSDSKAIELKFYLIAALVGMVLGGTQSLSRSTYSKLLPETEDHASFFSFYDVSEKIAIVFGTFLFGYLESVTGSMNRSILFLAIFFMASIIVLIGLRKTKSLQPIAKSKE